MKCATVCAIFAIMALVACTERPTAAPDQKSGADLSSANAASIGTTVPTMVELSDMYVSPEIYDIGDGC